MTIERDAMERFRSTFLSEQGTVFEAPSFANRDSLVVHELRVRSEIGLRRAFNVSYSDLRLVLNVMFTALVRERLS